MASILLIPACAKEEEPQTPEVITGSASASDYTSATINGNVVSEGSSKIIAQGFFWGKSSTSLENKIICKSDQKYFSAQIKGLKPKTFYVFKAFAVNSAGVSIGEPVTFTTKEGSQPLVQTLKPIAITSNSITISGNVLNENGDSVIARGFCWSSMFKEPTIDDIKMAPETGSIVTTGSGSGVFESKITGLVSMFDYHIRAYATNSKGTSYGEVINFKTVPVLPGAKTVGVKIVSPNLATCTIEYSIENRNTISKFGLCWNTVTIPTIQDSVIYQTNTHYRRSDINMKIDPNTRYIIRAFALNEAGIVYGDTISFTSWLNKPGPRISDSDSNVYPTVKIGRQVWMAENLRTTKYRNGDVITTTPIPTADIQSETNPKYQWPAKHNETIIEEYGRWYTWYTATDARGICPTGWHLPSKDEWSELHSFLHPESDLKISEKSEIHWYPGYKGNNLSGFTARALYYRQIDGTIWNSNSGAFWWSSSEATDDVTKSYYAPIHLPRYTYYPLPIDKKSGMAIRCIKD